MIHRHVIGVDTGNKGGIALLDPKGKMLSVIDVPLIWERRKGKKNPVALYDIQRIWDHINMIVDEYQLLTLCVERVHAMPTKDSSGKKMGGTVTNYRRGMAMGLWETIAAATCLPAYYPLPKTWQSRLGVAAGERASLKAAKVLYPEAGLKFITKDAGRAAALLIARYGVRWAGRFGSPNMRARQ